MASFNFESDLFSENTGITAGSNLIPGQGRQFQVSYIHILYFIFLFNYKAQDNTNNKSQLLSSLDPPNQSWLFFRLLCSHFVCLCFDCIQMYLVKKISVYKRNLSVFTVHLAETLDTYLQSFTFFLK